MGIYGTHFFIWEVRGNNKGRESFGRAARKDWCCRTRAYEELFGRDYNSFVDNWYTNEKLFRYLQENGTAACGTTRGNWL